MATKHFIMKQEIENKLIDKNTKPTSMRILVYDFLSTQNRALSLSEIENHFENADRTTIYRTLKTFEEKGIVHSIQEIQQQNIHYAMMIVMKKHTKTGIFISTAKSASKQPARKIFRFKKIVKPISELTK